jgi:ribosome-associated toxin RatA of RatAB toxin-antitoxin module
MWFKVKRSGLDIAESAGFSILQERVLDVGADELFELLADVEPWPKWFPGFLEARWLTDPPHGVGSVREARLQTIAVHERFIAWEPGRRWAFTLEAATVPVLKRMVEDYQLEALSDSLCRLTWNVYYTPRLALRPLHPLARPLVGRMFAHALDGLDRYVRNRR